jgi:hypothetical protein
VRPAPLADGSLVTLRPRAVVPRMQQMGRSTLRRRYQAGRNWLSGGGHAPVRRDRVVPLDVVISAAESL